MFRGHEVLRPIETSPSTPIAAILPMRLRKGRLEILLAQRLGGQEETGQFTPPGGKIGLGESPIGAALRELHEETGLTAEPNSLVPLTKEVIWSREGKYRYHLFSVPVNRCRGSIFQEPGGKQGPWQWYDLEEAFSLANHRRLHPAVVNFFQVPASILEDCLLIRLGLLG